MEQQLRQCVKDCSAHAEDTETAPKAESTGSGLSQLRDTANQLAPRMRRNWCTIGDGAGSYPAHPKNFNALIGQPGPQAALAR